LIFLVTIAPSVLRSLDRFQLLYIPQRPETIADGSNKCWLRCADSARLNPSLKCYLMDSDFFSCFCRRKLSVSQRYTYSIN